MESLSLSFEAFEEFLLIQIEISNMAIETLEWFIVLLYDCISDIMTIKDLFMQRTRSLENLPLTHNRLAHMEACEIVLQRGFQLVLAFLHP